MSKDYDKIRKYSMFFPKTGNGLLSDYPELKKIESFTKLNQHEMRFVWFYSCKASPYISEMDDATRMGLAMKESFGTKAKAVLETYLAGNIPEKIRIAINDMRKFEIGPRVRSKIMIEKIMANYEKLVEVDLDTEFLNKDSEIDWTKKKAYIDATATISRALPTLILQAEGGFGIIEKEEGDTLELNADDLIDEFHEQNS